MNQSVLLDLLRIFAIALVVMAHIGQTLGWGIGEFFGVRNFYYVSLGGVGVTVFLLLSGVLAGLSWAQKQTSYFSYLYKKLKRIYPVYWLSIPLSIAGYVIGEWLLNTHIPHIFPNGLRLDLVGSITGFYAWMGLWGGPYNSPSWFIALIMSMYVLFPAVYRLLQMQPHLIIFILFLISYYARLYIGESGVPFIEQSSFDGVKAYFYRLYGFMPGRPGDWFPLCRIFEFALGVYLAMLVPKHWWSTCLRGPNSFISFISRLCFPLFLVHYPFLFLLNIFDKWNVPIHASIVMYFFLVCFLAFLLNVIDSRIRAATLGFTQSKL